MRVIGILMILLGLAMLALGPSCYDTTKPPKPCANIMNCDDPTAVPPSVVLPTDPIAPVRPSTAGGPRCARLLYFWF